MRNLSIEQRKPLSGVLDQVDAELLQPGVGPLRRIAGDLDLDAPGRLRFR